MNRIQISTKQRLKSTLTSEIQTLCTPLSVPGTGVTSPYRVPPLTPTRVEMLIITAEEWALDGGKQPRVKPLLPFANMI